MHGYFTSYFFMLAHNNLILLYLMLRRERNLKLLATVIMLVGGAVFIVLMYRTQTVNLSVVCAVAAMTLMLLGFKFLYETLIVWQPKQHPVWLQITKKPKDIVWVYTQIVATSPYGLEVSGHGIMYLKLLNRTELSISVPRKQLRPLSESLNPVLPHATFGYSVERAQWYVADPSFLIRD